MTPPLPLLLALTAGCAPADPRVEHELQDTLDRYDIPGAAVILRVGGEERLRLALGEADPAVGAPMGTDTRVRIGSITKTLTALTLAELEQRGALALDEPVSRWVPGVPWGDFMTLRHLLTHTSGLRHYEDVPAYAKHQHDAWSAEAMLAAVAGEGHLVVPGEAFHYSSTGYLVAGMVMEAATGRPWQHVVRDVLHTQRHGPGISLEEAGAPLAIGHHDGPIRASRNADNGRAAAALVASADDLDAFFLALSRGDIVREEAWAEVSRRQVERSGDLAYGLGLNIWPDQHGHRGRVLGYAAAWRHRTDEDAQLVLTLNASEVSSMEVEEKVWEMLEAYGYLD